MIWVPVRLQWWKMDWCSFIREVQTALPSLLWPRYFFSCLFYSFWVWAVEKKKLRRFEPKPCFLSGLPPFPILRFRYKHKLSSVTLFSFVIFSFFFLIFPGRYLENYQPWPFILLFLVFFFLLLIMLFHYHSSYQCHGQYNSEYISNSKNMS